MFGINKNGTKHKIGIIMPAFFPSSRVTYDGGTVEDALLQLFGTGAGAANSRCYREEIASITADMWASIADGSFSKVHVGMHYTAPSGRTYWFADADYFYGFGNTEQTNHHMVVIEDKISITATHHTTGTTAGGAIASDIYTTTLPAHQSELETDFGVSHIIAQDLPLTSDVTSGLPSDYTFTSKSAFLMNANMVFGHPIFNAGNTSEIYNGMGRCKQLSVFRAMSEATIGRDSVNGNRINWWLDDIGSSANFGRVAAVGNLSTANASSSDFGVRRAFLIG